MPIPPHAPVSGRVLWVAGTGRASGPLLRHMMRRPRSRYARQAARSESAARVLPSPDVCGLDASRVATRRASAPDRRMDCEPTRSGVMQAGTYHAFPADAETWTESMHDAKPSPLILRPDAEG